MEEDNFSGARGDDMDEVYPLWDAADVIVVASPIYYGSISGQMHCLVHRTYAGGKPKAINSLGYTVLADVIKAHGRRFLLLKGLLTRAS